MQSRSEMQEGWDFAAKIMDADLSAYLGQEYVSRVESSIRQLEYNINNHPYRNLEAKQLQGYMLEEWSAGTFNVNAAASGSSDFASTLHSNGKNSVDIQLDSGKLYSAKSYATAEQTVKAQARLDAEIGKASYRGQGRLIPSDQLAEAKEVAHREALRNKPIRSDVSEAYSETGSELIDKITNDKGVSSKDVTRENLDNIAEESKGQKFKAEEHGVTANSEITPRYMLKQAMSAGVSAAAISVALQLAPEIIKAVDFLIKNGEIDIQQIKSMGIKGISAGAEGFIRGSVSASLEIMCLKGSFGTALKGIAPPVLGAIVAVAMQTVKNSILVAAGKMNAQQMGAAFIDTAVISSGCLLGAHIGGAIGQALGFELPIIGYLLGSLIGTSFSVAYNIGKKKFISFCVDTGFTCFGLVDQDYELPEEVLHEIGVETIPIPRTQIERTDIARTQMQTAAIDKTEYETVELTVLRRGVIGVNKIGYVMN